MLTLVLLTPLLGLLIALPATALLIRLGHRLSALDSVGAAGHAKVLRAVPNIGGVAIALAVAGPLLAFAAGWQLLGPAQMSGLVPSLEPFAGRLSESVPAALALVACLLALHITGVVDDRRALGWRSKLLVQLLCASLLAAFFDVRLLTVLDHRLPLGPLPSMVLAVLWIVVVCNAINFMDNMDGLAGGVAAISSSLFMIAAILNEQWFIASALGLLAGGLAGFLVFNFPPARIFMGDGGSLLVGFLLGVLTARTTFFDPEHPERALSGGWYAVFMPLIVLAVPLYDFASVTMLRLRQGRSPFVGDQQHFSHRLVQRGLSRRGAVLFIWSVTLVSGLGGIALGSLQPWQAVLVGVQTLLLLGMLAGLEYAGRARR
jgi:UDP-GlcNAc:undecaprenyl-phosphate GlcNAc-1-phosphate transferase